MIAKESENNGFFTEDIYRLQGAGWANELVDILFDCRPTIIYKPEFVCYYSLWQNTKDNMKACIRNKIIYFFLGHPRFFNQLSTGLDVIGLAGEWLTSTANTNM